MDLDGSSLVASILQAAPISDRHDPSIAPWCRLLLAGVVGNGSLSDSEKSTCFQAWALECPDAVTDITTSALLVRRFVDQNIASRSQTRRFMVRLIAHWGSIGSSVLPTTRDLFLLMELIDEGPLWTAFARKLSSDLSMSFSTTAYRLARSLSATDTTSDELHMTEDAHVLAWRFSRLLSSIRITCGEIGKPKVMDAHRGTHCSSGFKGFLSAIELDDLRLEEQDHRALAALAKTIISTTDTDRMVVERVSKILDALSSKIMDKSTAMDSITSILELMLGLRAKGVEYSIYDAHGDTESSVNQVTTPRLALVRELAALPWMTTFINRCEELLLFCFSDTSGDGDVDERHVNWAMRASLQAQFLDIPKQKRRESNFRRLLLELFKLLAVAHPDSAQRAKCSALVIDVLFSCGKRLTVEGISAAHFITPTSISSDTERAELRRDILDHVQLLARSYYVENDALALHFVATLLKGIASLGPDHHGHDSTYSALYAWCARQQSEIGQQQLPDILRLHYESARFAGADGVYISDALSLLTSDSVPVCMASTRALIAVGQRSDYASDVVFDRAIDAIRMNVEANRFLAVNSLSIAMICEFIAASAHAFPRAFILVAEYGTSRPSDKLLLALATAAGFASVQSMLTQSMPFLWYQWRSRRPALERVPSYFFDIKLNESDACLVKPVGILLHLFPNSWKELANSYKDENTMALIEDGFTTLLSCAIITDVCTGDESAVSAVSLSLGLPVFRARVLKHITTIALICAVLIAEQDIQAAGKIVRRAHSDDKLLEKFFPEDEMRQRANIIATMWAMVKQKISACMEVENDSILDPTHVFLLLAHLATQCKNAVLPTRKRDLLLVVLTLTALQQANRADSSHCFCERATIELCDIVHETPQHATLIDLFLSALVVRCAPRAEVITAVVKAMDSGIVAHLQSVQTGSFFHEARMFLKRANVMFVAACELSPCTSASGIEEIVDSVNLLPAGSANLPAYWNRIDTDFATISVGSCDGINALQACKRLKQLACRIKRVIDDKLAEISNGENNDSRLNDSAFFLLSTIAPFVELTCSSDNTAVHTVVDHEDAFVQTLVHRLLVGRATIAEAALASLQALSRSRDKLWLDLLSSTPGMSELLHQSDKSAAAVQLNMGDGDDSHTFPAKSRNGVSDIWTVRTHSALVAVLPAHDILRGRRYVRDLTCVLLIIPSPCRTFRSRR